MSTYSIFFFVIPTKSLAVSHYLNLATQLKYTFPTTNKLTFYMKENIFLYRYKGINCIIDTINFVSNDLV